MRYRLRTLLIVFAVAPAVIWLAWLGGVPAMVVYLSILAICIPAFVAGLVVGWLIDLRPRKVRERRIAGENRSPMPGRQSNMTRPNGHVRLSVAGSNMTDPTCDLIDTSVHYVYNYWTERRSLASWW
jgi:hypothetical protein